MKKFEQVKRLYHTMCDEYNHYSNDKIFVSAITADFDRLFELCWKSLKEYLLKNKYIAEARSGSPKDILKLAYRENLIHDEIMWLQLLADRNDDSHHYNESAARSYAARIVRDYIPKIGSFIEDMSNYIPEESGILVNVPDDFIKACDLSGMFYDEFLHKVKIENGCATDLEVFEKWDHMKEKYL